MRGRAVPNLSLQRTASRRLAAAELRSLGVEKVTSRNLMLVLAGAGLIMPGLLCAADLSLSRRQADSLAREIVRHTPEHLHWVKGWRFSWVIFNMPDTDPFREVRERVRIRLAARYQVFSSESEVPPAMVVRDDTEPVPGPRYIDGFKFSYEISVLDNGDIEIRYSDYEAPMAASAQRVRYRWILWRWFVVWKEPLAVS